MHLRKAKPSEAGKILEFYQNVIESIKNTDFKPKWNDMYPNLDYISSSIEKEELYIYTDNTEIVSSFILNSYFDNDYSNVKWPVSADGDEITIIHTFAVNASYRSKGLSGEIFKEIQKIALMNNKKALRIDIVGGNVGAQKVFEKLGFKYVTTVEIIHYAVGLQDFHLYEYPLNE